MPPYDDCLRQARAVAFATLPGRLQFAPVLDADLGDIVRRSIRRTLRVARQRQARMEALFAAFPTATPFVRWFGSRAHAVSLRWAFRVEEVTACVATLPTTQQQALEWLYIDQFDYRQLAHALRLEPQEAAELAEGAYRALRQALSLRVGEANDAFPVFPAGAGRRI